MEEVNKEISKVKLDNGVVYELKDAWVREQIRKLIGDPTIIEESSEDGKELNKQDTHD